MPGTERLVVTPTLVRHFTTLGWLLLGGEIGFLLFQAERVRTVDGSRFATAWDQRVEVMSFLMLPPNMVTLVPAAAVAVGTTWLVDRSMRGPWLDVLLRLVAAIAITLMFVGVASVVEIITREGQGNELDGVFLRLGGMSMAAGIAWMCRMADVSSSTRSLG